MVTGGANSLQRVTQYSLTGEVTYLADLQHGRWGHACTSFIDDDGVTVSLVVNGKYYEIYDNYYVVDTACNRRSGVCNCRRKYSKY